MRLNKVPIVPQNEPLLGILDRFQEGRSHMAIVSRMSTERAQSVKKAVKKGLTHRLLGAVRGDSSSSDSSSDDSGDDDDEGTTAVGSDRKHSRDNNATDNTTVDDVGETADEKHPHHRFRGRIRKPKHLRRGSKQNENDLEKGNVDAEKKREKRGALEQTMPADAVMSKANAEEYIATQAFTLEPELMPLGIITLEDVLEGNSWLYCSRPFS